MISATLRCIDHLMSCNFSFMWISNVAIRATGLPRDRAKIGCRFAFDVDARGLTTDTHVHLELRVERILSAQSSHIHIYVCT